MSDASEKPFDATPSRIAKARREGNIARSQEVGANAAFLAAVACAVASAPLFAGFAQRAIYAAAARRLTLADVVPIVLAGVAVIGAGAAGGAAASIAQNGGIVVVAPSLKWARVNPADGLKRMLSRETAAHAVRALLAFVLATAAIAASIRQVVFASGGTGDVMRIASAAWSASQRVVFAAAACGMTFALVEYGAARKTWLAKLKMSLHELKRETKENDGDPAARARRKSLHRTLARGAIAKVKDASFVVVNPTHVAVALEYRPPSVPVPVVLVRAADEMALRVRAAAADAGLPVIENVPLARALFAQTHVGDAIPGEQYLAVAEIVASLVRSGMLQ